METPKTQEQSGAVYELVSKAKQKEALDFLQKQLFNTPTWLIDQSVFDKTGQSALTIIGSVQDNILGRIMSNRTLTKLVDAEASNGNKAYGILDYMNDLRAGIWSELATKKPIDIYRRNLQKTYVNNLVSILNPAPAQAAGGFGGFGGNSQPQISAEKSDVKTVVRAHLQRIRSEATASAAGYTDTMSKIHLQDIADRITKALDPK